MTKKLEELFDLPLSGPDNFEKSDQINIPVTKETIAEIDATIDKIDAALPGVRDLDKSDEELDNLAKLAQDSFEDLSDLGMNVDSRYASEIFSVASTMLGHAITAKTAKLNKKLKMIDLQLKKAKFDRDGANGEESAIATGTGHILDRNELLERLVKREQPKKP
jgi:hypothetical protein